MSPSRSQKVKSDKDTGAEPNEIWICYTSTLARNDGYEKLRY